MSDCILWHASISTEGYCKHGHAYAEHVYWRSDGGRDCRVCMRARQKR